MKKSDVLFVVFDALQIRSFNVWEFLEEIDSRKMVFVMTGCDKATPEILQNNKIKLHQYIEEAGITAPIFMCSCAECNYIEESANLTSLKKYVQEQVLGETPTLTKQYQNVQHLEEMLQAFGNSFALRRRQFEADKVILENINTSMDNFLARNEGTVEMLKSELRNIISTQIDAYEKEIISKMDPAKIKQRCPGGPSDMEAYLGVVNENYRNIMNDRISHTTQESIRKYCSELQDVFEEATGFFRKRESLLNAEDKFYGSLEMSKKEMLYESNHMMLDLSNFYKELADASEELFMGIWRARDEFDKGKKVSILGGVAGVAGGLGIGSAGAFLAANAAAGTAAGAAAQAAAQAAATVATAATTTTAMSLSIGSILWPIVGAIVGAIIISAIAKKLYKATHSKTDMLAAYEECVAEFKQEVAKIKEEMTEEVLQTVTKIFDREVRSMDNAFKDFRMVVNIDSRNIPLLEEKLQTVQNLMEQIDQLKHDREAQFAELNRVEVKVENVMEYKTE